MPDEYDYLMTVMLYTGPPGPQFTTPVLYGKCGLGQNLKSPGCVVCQAPITAASPLCPR